MAHAALFAVTVAGLWSWLTMGPMVIRAFENDQAQRR